MKLPSEAVRISPMFAAFSTAAASAAAGKVRLTDLGNFSVICGVKCDTLASGFTATAAAQWDFVVNESTAASAAGSAITGATLTLGAATAAQVRGAVVGFCRVASNVGTAVALTINGYEYHCTGAGATAMNGSLKMARAINGLGTSIKLPHYTAVGDYLAANQLLISCDDGQGTGLSYETTAAAATVAPYMMLLQGVVNISPGKLSTNTPKYIGVACTPLTGGNTSLMFAHYAETPKVMPSFPGKVVNLTT